MRFVSIVLALLLVPAAFASPSEDRTVSAAYVGFGGSASGLEPDFPFCMKEGNIGGACFPLHLDDEAVTVTLRDDVAPKVCAVARWGNDTGTTYVPFCGSATFPLVNAEGATTLYVKVTLPLLGAPPTTGTITVAFQARE